MRLFQKRLKDGIEENITYSYYIGTNYAIIDVSISAFCDCLPKYSYGYSEFYRSNNFINIAYTLLTRLSNKDITSDDEIFRYKVLNYFNSLLDNLTVDNFPETVKHTIEDPMELDVVQGKFEKMNIIE